MKPSSLNRREFITCGAASLALGTLSSVHAIDGPDLRAAIIEPDAVAAQRFLQALAARGVAPQVIAYETCACRLPLTGLPNFIARLVVFLPATQAYVVEQDALLRGYRLRLAAQPLGVESRALIDHLSADASLLELDATPAEWAHRCAHLCGALYVTGMHPRGGRQRQKLRAIPNDSATLLLLEKVQSGEAAS